MCESDRASRTSPRQPSAHRSAHSANLLGHSGRVPLYSLNLMNPNHRNVYLYVLDSLADWEIGFITAELRSGRYLKNEGALTLTLIGATLDPVTTMGGISLTPERRVGEIDFEKGDAVILPGADTWMDGSHLDVLRLAPDLTRAGVTVAAICGATVALAGTGALDTRRHTSNDRGFLALACPEYSGDAFYAEAPVVVDGQLITATGLAPLEFAHALFRHLEVMHPAVLAAWYRLYETQDGRHFQTLMAALTPD